MKLFLVKIVTLIREKSLFATQDDHVILSQVENEYGNVKPVYGIGGELYVKWAAATALALNTTVPWILCQQEDASDPIECGVYMEAANCFGESKGCHSEEKMQLQKLGVLKNVEYEDSDVEQITLENEKIKFHISSEEMQDLHLSFNDPSMDKKVPDGDEMLALAVSFGDCQNLELGDVVWGKITAFSETNNF